MVYQKSDWCTSFHIDIFRSGRNTAERRNGSKTKILEAFFHGVSVLTTDWHPAC